MADVPPPTLSTSVPSRLIGALGAVLILTGVVCTVTGGFAFHVGTLSVSARDPARLFMEGCLALLVSSSMQPVGGVFGTRARWLALLMAFYVALIAESAPRRVGDGHEYVATAYRLSRLSAPSVAHADEPQLRATIRQHAGMATWADAPPDLHGRDGRVEYLHFWIYPALVAPFLRGADAIGVSWNRAFTFVNLLLLVAFALVAWRRLSHGLLTLFLTGPILWWIDKAHAEVFTYTTLGSGLLLLEHAPHASVLILAVLAAQTPVFLLVLCPVMALAWFRSGKRRETMAVCGLAAAVASLHPLYYAVRTGTPFPLAGASSWSLPSATAIVTPLVDPLAGLLWYAPGLLVLPLLARRRAGHPLSWEGVVLGGAALGLMVVFALSGNLNHGASPGPSRYGIWMLPFLAWWLADAVPPTGWRRLALSTAIAGSIVHAAWVFHPRLGEDSQHTPPVSAWLLDAMPWIYDPVPEVFAERFGRFDGPAVLPISTPGCGKVLLAGNGTVRPLWPFPCVPQAMPEACRPEGALCYANRQRDGSYGFRTAPVQPGLAVAQETSALTWTAVDDFAATPRPVEWRGLRSVPPGSTASVIRQAQHVKRIRSFQSDGQLVAFVEPLGDGAPLVRLDPWSGGCGWWLRADDHGVVGSFAIAPSQQVVAPYDGAFVLFAEKDCEGREP